MCRRGACTPFPGNDGLRPGQRQPHRAAGLPSGPAQGCRSPALKPGLPGAPEPGLGWGGARLSPATLQGRPAAFGCDTRCHQPSAAPGPESASPHESRPGPGAWGRPCTASGACYLTHVRGTGRPFRLQAGLFPHGLGVSKVPDPSSRLLHSSSSGRGGPRAHRSPRAAGAGPEAESEGLVSRQPPQSPTLSLGPVAPALPLRERQPRLQHPDPRAWLPPPPCVLQLPRKDPWLKGPALGPGNPWSLGSSKTFACRPGGLRGTCQAPLPTSAPLRAMMLPVHPGPFGGHLPPHAHTHTPGTRLLLWAYTCGPQGLATSLSTDTPPPGDRRHAADGHGTVCAHAPSQAPEHLHPCVLAAPRLSPGAPVPREATSSCLSPSPHALFQ